ncbi:hypothetical protein E2C01_097743 [Portunus trituberculatus]|uniref:Uncharacterized protein n=1 Tax=Portunus trituberculatus TaxID=210409 RepID=A0A5B7JW03_PORTR|nr:hypothetical protein [Portunus trituberculatus]
MSIKGLLYNPPFNGSQAGTESVPDWLSQKREDYNTNNWMQLPATLPASLEMQ